MKYRAKAGKEGNFPLFSRIFPCIRGPLSGDWARRTASSTTPLRMSGSRLKKACTRRSNMIYVSSLPCPDHNQPPT